MGSDQVFRSVCPASFSGLNLLITKKKIEKNLGPPPPKKILECDKNYGPIRGCKGKGDEKKDGNEISMDKVKKAKT